MSSRPLRYITSIKSFRVCDNPVSKIHSGREEVQGRKDGGREREEGLDKVHERVRKVGVC